MKLITSTLTGLTSSLLFNAGFTQAAQKLDPISGQATQMSQASHGPSFTQPCQFTPRQRKL